MEKITDELRHFLSVPNHDDSGSGSVLVCDDSGSGFGYCFGSGSGSGSDGYGDSNSGSGSGFGFGSGSGSGGNGDSDSDSDYDAGYGCGCIANYDLVAFERHLVHYIDEIPTVIKYIKGNLAKGFIVNRNLTTSPCYIAKCGGLFAHGESAEKAVTALQSKIFANMDPEEKIEAFLKEFELGVKYPAIRFYEWHNKLTGSCEMGRKSFARDHGIDIDNGLYTVEEFIEITRDAYGGEIIKKIEERILLK